MFWLKKHRDIFSGPPPSGMDKETVIKKLTKRKLIGGELI